MEKKKIKFISLFASFLLFLVIFVNCNENKVYARDEYHNAYDYYQTYGSDSCRFAVVDGQARIYFNAYGTKGSSSSVRYRTIGWKANLYLNGAYQESAYFSLNGSFVLNASNITSGNVEYNLYYIYLNDLIRRFNNQSAITSGKAEIKLDAIMSIVPANSNTPNGSTDDNGNYTGEVYDTYSGIANARGWAHPGDLQSRFNKVPTGMYRTVTVTGGTGIASTSGSGTYIYGTRATVSATCSTGYDFNGWSNGKTTTAFRVEVTDNLSFSCSGKLKKYTVSYDANGGTGAPGNQTKTYGTNLTLSSQKPTKTGYLFDYWNGSDGKTYVPGAAFGTNADTKMTAHWTAITYYVSYNSNKPSKASSNPTGIMLNSEHKYLPASALRENVYDLKGWSFEKWNSKADGSGTNYADKAYVSKLTTTNKATVPMYAQWKPNVYRLMLDEQYATISGTQMIYEKYDYDWYKDSTTKTTTAKITTPKKIGMKFNGYYTEKNGKGTKYIDANGKIVVPCNTIDKNNTYVYAQWIPDIFDISLDNQGATSAGSTHIYEEYSVGFYDTSACSAGSSKMSKITLPKKDNYTFDGYWTEQNTWKSSKGEQIVQADGTVNDVNTRFTENSTIYAKWIPVDYKINLDNQGADIDKGTAAFYEKYNEFNYTTMGDYDVNTGIATIRYDYTGNVQYFIAPADGEYTLNVAGAQGGDLKSGKGGYGGESTGKVKLKKGDTLRIYVGNKPTAYNSSFNGSSGWAAHDIIGGSCAAGGGATDIRKNGDSLEDRIIVAGAGGGATEYGWDPNNVAVDGGTGGENPSNVKYICQFGSHVKEIGTTNTKGATQSKNYNYTTPEKYRSYYKIHESDIAGVEKYSHIYIGNENSGSGWGFISINYNAKDYNLGYNNGGGGYYGGGFMHGNCIMPGGLGGSSYIGGVTDGAMTTGTNSGNGYATISYNTKELGQYNVVEKYFNYTGSVQTFTAPTDGEYLLEVAGAQGGAADYAKELGLSGGKGGVSTGKVTLKKGEVLNIYVGQEGAPTCDAFNGGRYGQATFTEKFDRDKRTDGGGGGATDIRKGGTDLNNRIIVAGGGGGATTYGYHGVNGGDGGGTTAGELKWVGWTGGAWDSKGVPPTIIGNSKLSPAGQTFSTDPDVAKKATLQPPATDKTSADGKNTPYAGSLGQGGYSSGGGYYGGTRYRGVASATSADIGKSENPSGYRALYAQYSGGGGSGYTGGVTNGSMTTGTNKGNGWAKITYTNYDLDSISACSIRVPQKTGYTFDGYWTGKNGTGEQVIDYKGDVWSNTTYFNNTNTKNNETTIYAKWANNTYNFVYDGNGGKVSSGSGAITVTDRVKYNTNYHVRNGDIFKAPAGYKFAGWNEKADGSGQSWAPDNNITYNLPHGTKVYAQWKAVDVNYTINYYKQNLNGTYNSTPSASEKRSGKTDSIISVKPTTDKAVFDSTGFELDADKSYADESSFASKDKGIVSVKILGNGKTVVNYYYSRKSYKVTLNVAKDDKGFSSLKGAGTYKYGATVDISAILNDKFEFVAWKNADGTVFSNNMDTTFDMPAKDVTLTAYSNSNGKPDPVVTEYTVTVRHYFQNSSGTYTLNDTTSEKVEENTLYVPRYKPIITGYSAVRMEDNATKEDVSNGIVVTKDVTVNAYYDRAQYQIVTEYYVDNALYETRSENAFYNDSYKVKELDITGYHLDKIVVPVYNKNPFTVTQDMTGGNKIKVYYVAKTFTVTFDANSGVVTDNSKQVAKTTRKVKYNGTDNNDVSSLKPTRTGYSFVGWYTDKEGGSQVYTKEGKCNNDDTYWSNNKWCATSDLTVYAHWKANTYTLTFDANGGLVNDNETTAKCTPTYDKPFFNDVEYLNPQKTGYTFAGWYTAKTGGTQIYNNKGKCTNDGTYWKNGNWHYTGNATLYAQWKANTYKVIYNSNGGTGTMSADTATYDSNYTTKSNEFSRSGYKFIGWNEKPDGTGTDWTSKIGKPFKWNYTNDVTLYAQWQGIKAKICYHSEDEKHNITKEYQVDAGQKFETASDWWRKQKFTSAYEPGNSIFAGWTTKKGSTDDMYSENAAVPNKLITDNVNSTIDLYSIWDKPTVTITPTSNNVSFNCNNKTWYKDTIEFKLTGTDKRYNVIGFDFVLNGNKSGNWRTTNNGKSLTHTFSTSEFYTGGLRTVISKGNPFTVKVWSESSTATSGTPMGSSDALSTQYWIDFTAPDLTYSVDSSHNIKATATDGESGVDTIDLQSYRDGQWVSVKKVTASSSQYGQFVNTFNLNQSDYKYRYRITATDHLGNSKTSNEFYVVPLTLSTSLSKLNGDAVYNGQTLEFIAGGDLNATVNVNITGYAEKVKYEFANELGQVTDTHVGSYDASGNTTETKQFLIPWEIEHNKNYYVKVTAYRGSESASTVEYVKLSDIDFSKFRSNILYQSGQHD